jgi:hypothetical protein
VSDAKALGTYLRLRHRRAKLAQLPPDSKAVTYERFTVAEAEALQVAEREISRLSGAAAIELLIRNKSNVLGYL